MTDTLNNNEEIELLNTLKTKIEECYVVSFRCNPIDPVYFQKERHEYFHVECGIGLSEDISRIIIILSSVVTPIDDKKKELVFLQTHTTFFVENLKNCIKDNVAYIPKKFYGGIISNAVSTLRGILLSKTADTIYSSIVMPLISIDPLIPKEPLRLIKATTLAPPPDTTV